MHILFGAVAFAVAVSGQAANNGSFSAQAGSRTEVSSDLTGVVPGRYIVEVRPTARGRRGESGVQAVVQDMQAQGYEATVKQDYSSVSTRFSGGSIEVSEGTSSATGGSGGTTNTSLADAILALPAVTNVWPVHTITLNASSYQDSNQATWTPHAATRVSALHAQGWKGQGQRVCVVDTGVDATHPALQGRVAGGRNMLDDTDNVRDVCLGHGTFVSSQIVANHADLQGVAPEAQIYMYRVFGECAQSTTTDVLIKGLLAADADGCEIVSVSIGTGTGYRYAVTSRVAAAVAEDRLVIFAAGNDGGQGPYYASSPAVGQGVLSVGSVEAAQVVAWPAQLVAADGATFDLAYTTKDGAKFNESIDVGVDLDRGDACNPVGKTTAADRAVLVRRGVCAERYAARQIEWAGYQYGLVFDSYDQGVYYATDVANYYWGSLRLYAHTAARVGEWAAQHNTSSLRLVIHADATPLATDAIDLKDVPQAGQVSSTSSWGPSFENDGSPQVVAPGGAVFGAYPNGRFVIGSGTSYAAPYVAGLAALVYSQGFKDKEAFKRRLISTSHALPTFNALDNRVRAANVSGTVAQQGAGLIDAEAFLAGGDGVTLLSSPVLHLNDTDHRVRTHTIQLHNPSDADVTFRISHSPSVSVRSRNVLLYPYEYYPPLVEGVYGSLEAPETVQVAAGATADVSVTLNSPPNVDPSLGLLWSGKVVFESDAETLTVPYLAFEASTYSWGTLHHGPEVFRYDAGVLYPVDFLGRSKPFRPYEFDSPEIWFALRYGTYEFSIDIVGEDYRPDTDFVYPPVASVGRRAWYGAIRQQSAASSSPNDFPQRELARFSNAGYVTFRSLANGTAIPSGRYRTLSRALRIFGDASNPKDWQLFLSDPFWVQHGTDPLPNITTTATSTSTSTSTSTTSTTSTSSTTLSTSTTSATSTTTSSVSQTRSTATSEAPATVTSVPGPTTTLTPAATPTGYPAGLKLNLQRYQEESQALPDAGVWLELHIQIDLPVAVPADSVIRFGVPAALVDFPNDEYLQAGGSSAGRFYFDAKAHVASINLADWTTWHKNMRGDFYVMCRFNASYAAAMAPGTYIAQFSVPTANSSTILSSPLYHSAIDRTQVYEHQSVVPYAPNSGQLFVADIEVPAALGPWTLVQLQVVQVNEDGFICDQSGVYVGYASRCPADGNRITDRTLLADVSDASLRRGDKTRCDVHNYVARYEHPLDGPRHALRFRAAGIQGDNTQWTYGLTYALDVVLANGTTVLYPYKTINFEKNPRKRSPNFYEFYGDRA